MTPATFTILIAEDDPDDRMIAERAWVKSEIAGTLRFVEDGADLLDYLNHRGAFTDTTAFPMPSIMLIDLNMPRMDGREAIREIKSDPRFRRIPIIVLTTSQEEADVIQTYRLGVNSFISKPMTYTKLSNVIRSICEYWLDIVELPPRLTDEDS